MIERLGFYFRHSLNDLRVNGRRTVFALLCIAAGVAAIVSLQTLAVMIQTTLTGNLQINNRGDIQLQPGSTFMARTDETVVNTAATDGLLVKQTQSVFGQSEDSYLFTLQGVDVIRQWLAEQYPGSEVTYRQQLSDPLGLFFGNGLGTTLTADASGREASQINPVVVETKVYPFYDQVVTKEGIPLAEAINSPTDLVLSDTVASILQVSVGDTILASGASEPFTVRGTVDSNQEVRNPTSDIFSALFGFYYLDVSAMPLFADGNPEAEIIYVRLPESTDVTAASTALTQQFPFLATVTTDDLRENYSLLAENINTLVTVMGLLSMLVGAIGIINTMQVIVRRRTVEIAVLKTLGLQANQITTLFLVEAILMGILGSLIGVLFGWATIFLIRGAAERLLATDLPFVFAAAPAIRGIVVGVIVTAIFGLLPTLTAGQVRPGTVLRPEDAVLPRAGRIRVLFALLLIIVVLSLIAQSVLGSLMLAFVVVIGAFVAAGFLYLALSITIWVIGRFLPSFGSVDLKVSLRQMLASRPRAAITLLALVVGVFSLSTITLLSSSITGLLQFALEDASGGNVTISVASPLQLRGVEEALHSVEGVTDYRVLQSYDMKLVSLEENGQTVSLDNLSERVRNSREYAAIRSFSGGASDNELNYGELLQAQLSRVGVYAPSDLPQRDMIAGRALTAADAGQPYITLVDNTTVQAAGIDVGDKLDFEVSNAGLLPIGGQGEPQKVTLEVIGIARESMVNGFQTNNDVLQGALPDTIQPSGASIVANIKPEAIPDVRRALMGTLGVFVIENAALTRLINGLLGTFTAFPTMVAALGLIVGGVVIANSVALTTLERRREIAVMKAVGLQRGRVLFMLLLENALLGLVGGLVGVGMGLVGVIVFASQSGAPGSAVPYGTALLLMLLCIAVALIAALSSAWGAAGEKPLNVLRYE